MPTLSPHPPPNTQSPPEKTHTPDQPPQSSGSVVNSPPPSAGVDIKNDISTPNVVSIPTLKRPVLCSKDYESGIGEEEHSLDLLYDYSTLDAW